MKKLLCVACLATFVLSFANTNVQADVVVAHWTFEDTQPTTAGPHAAELGIQAGSANATAFHAGGTAVYSTPAGNGSPRSFSSNGWLTVGDYYQFQVDLTGLSDATVQWDQTRSGTGPSNFDLLWSIDGTNFTQLLNYDVTQVTWNANTSNSDSTFGPIALPSAVDGQSAVFVRLATTVTTPQAGTNRVDNVIIRAVPEPGTISLLTFASMFGLAYRRRR